MRASRRVLVLIADLVGEYVLEVRARLTSPDPFDPSWPTEARAILPFSVKGPPPTGYSPVCIPSRCFE
jgi:hypothetical protein